MKRFVLFLVFGALSTALPSDRRRASAPCPYHYGGDSAREPLIEDSYVVELYADYSLSKHFEFIGRNLSGDSQVSHFQFMRNFNSYGVRVDEDTLHNRIRYDPGVRAVSHNRVFNPEIRYLQHGERDEKVPRKNLHAKRSWPDWFKRRTYGHWSREYLQKWDSKIPSWYSWWDMYTINEVGKGVDIYILDHGMLISHGQFSRRGKARDFRKQYTDEDMGTDLSHGTAVGGVASFHAPWSNIINVKVLGEGGTYQRIFEAINDIIDDHKSFQQNDPDFNFKGSVINMSFGYDYDFAPFRTAFQAAFDAGIPVITSAGNGNNPKGTFPCGIDGIVCVGAVAQDYHKAGDSNYGEGVTVFAPGHDIFTCGNKSDENYIITSGTSVASPAVAGLFAGWISFENIRDDWGKAMERLKLNWHEGKLTDATPNILAHSGLDHPNKADSSCPWNGPTNCNHGEDNKEQDSQDVEVDPNNNPAKEDTIFLEEPKIEGAPFTLDPGPPQPNDPATPGCPQGCQCSSIAILCA